MIAALPSLVQPLAGTLLILWFLSRFFFGVSVRYLAVCVYLELRLTLQTTLVRFFGATKDQAGIGKDKANLATKQSALALRGVKLATSDGNHSHGRQSLPAKPVSDMFRPGDLPHGEEVEYAQLLAEKSSSSKAVFPWHFGRAPREEASLGAVEDDAWQHRVHCLREAAEVHRQVRQHVQRKVRPGMQLFEIVDMVEKASTTLVGFDSNNPLRKSWAFPTGLSLNEVAAHDTVNPGDPCRCLLSTDIAKLDFGIQVEGHIVDCAFTFTFDPMHDELMQAVQDATNEGIRRAGPDALVCEIGGHIREVMESAEVHRPNGKVLPVKAIQNLTGHSIAPYRIHDGKSLPSVDTGGSARMLSGELWAVETFGSVGGLGYVLNQANCSHFMRPSSAAPNAIQRSTMGPRARMLLELIDRRFGTLAFCPRWLTQEAVRCKSPLLKGSGSDPRWWAASLDELCNSGVVNKYPPLADLPGSHTAQYEHTILLGARSKEVLTRGLDF